MTDDAHQKLAGDIQMCEAVIPPEGSSTRALSNCVIFSQNGERDLASQLSGGDLDGDLYNVIYDERLFPKWSSEAADYPRVSARSIGRAVKPTDMSDFFLEFMETDRLGYISNLHMQASDWISMQVRERLQTESSNVIVKDRQKLPILEPGESGVYSADSIKLAEMASTAVDFSKSGVPVSNTIASQFDMNYEPSCDFQPQLKMNFDLEKGSSQICH